MLLHTTDKHTLENKMYVCLSGKYTHIKVTLKLKVSCTTRRVLWLIYFLNSDTDSVST